MGNPRTRTATVRQIVIYPLSIRLRKRVEHASAGRHVSDSVVVAVELASGVVGYGETLARPYVTGETTETVLSAVRETYAPALLSFHPGSFPEALEFIEALPITDSSGRVTAAARAAVELALLDAAMKHFGRSVDDIVQWLGLTGFGSPGSIARVRFSGVLAAETTASTLRDLRFMYWFGLRDFKLKVGVVGDHERLRRVVSYLQRPLASGRASLRLDANGAWTLEQATAWLDGVRDLPMAAMEQPLARGREEDLPELKARVPITLLHDESLVTIEDARRLIGLGVADAFSIRLSKCGGLLPSLQIASLARREGVRIQLGCMVGETSILSAAGLRFLQVCPNVTWAEGCFGTWLLNADVVRKTLRFGFGGRPPRSTGAGLTAPVEQRRLESLCAERPIALVL